jgi:hypothetical protein
LQSKSQTYRNQFFAINFIISIIECALLKILKAPERLHGRKILGPKAIDEYNLFFGHSGANLNFIIFFTIAISNNIKTVLTQIAT